MDVWFSPSKAVTFVKSSQFHLSNFVILLCRQLFPKILQFLPTRFQQVSGVCIFSTISTVELVMIFSPQPCLLVWPLRLPPRSLRPLPMVWKIGESWVDSPESTWTRHSSSRVEVWIGKGDLLARVLYDLPESYGTRTSQLFQRGLLKTKKLD